MSNVNGNLNNSAGVRLNLEEDGDDSLAIWLRANFKGQQGTGGQVTLTDTQEQRETRR